jgi:anti-sigma factor RsiW
VTHLGQRLSALIDGELDGSERERVVVHVGKCASCRDEVAALRMLKRRVNAIREEAVGSGLTGRLMGLGSLANPDGADWSSGVAPADSAWPQRPGSIPVPDPPDRPARPEQRAGRYFLAGSLVIFLAGLGTAAVIAGGEPQPLAPTPPVTPSVDVLVFPHGSSAGSETGAQPAAGPSTFRPGQPRTSLHRIRPGS